MGTINVLMVGTGEYTTGFVPGATAALDKKAGVVGMTLFDLRRRRLVDRLLMAGTNGMKFPGIREHLAQAIGLAYRGMDLQFESFPSDDVVSDPRAYKYAIQQLEQGDAVIVFTPDDTHEAIAIEAIDRGCHVLIAKPITKTLQQHLHLVDRARARGVLCAVELHKRWDPIYVDARQRILALGDFSFFQSYMSQPKSQLKTFQAWAGISSDISYYLNDHHIDFHAWCCFPKVRPIVVRASCATGVAPSMGLPCEDTITLTVDWLNGASQHRGVAVYTASWIAPKSDVHSQQRFFYMGHAGEVTVDQAHRGYSVATDMLGYASPNPLFMSQIPDTRGYFAGQNGYGYRSIESFVAAAEAIKNHRASLGDFRCQLAMAEDTLVTTAILEAGRRSLDAGGKAIEIDYDASDTPVFRGR